MPGHNIRIQLRHLPGAISPFPMKTTDYIILKERQYLRSHYLKLLKRVEAEATRT